MRRNKRRVFAASLLGCVLFAGAAAHADKGEEHNYSGLALGARGEIAIVDQATDTVSIWSRRGKLLVRFGGEGSAEGSLREPRGVTFGWAGIVVADTGNRRVCVFDEKGRHQFSIGAAGQEEFARPIDVAIDSHGDLYVVDTDKNCLQIYDASGDFIATFGEEGTEHGQFRRPLGIAVDSRDRVTVADCGNQRVELFERGVHPGELRHAATLYSFFGPHGVSVDAADHIIVTESWGGSVLVFDADGRPIGERTHWGLKALEGACDAVMTDAGRIYVAAPGRRELVCLGLDELQPYRRDRGIRGLAMNARGELLVVEEQSHLVRVLDATGEELAQLGHWGSGPGRFCWPRAVAVRSDGSLVVVQVGDSHGQLLSADGEWIATFGEKGATEGELNEPWDVCVDGDDWIYVSDAAGHCIQVYDGEGAFVTAFGCEGEGPGEFRSPGGIAVDEAGHIIVGDAGNERLQVLALDKTSGEISFLHASDKGLGTYWDICVANDGRLVGLDAPQRVVKLLDANTFELLGKFRANSVGGLAKTHALAVHGDAVYIGDTGHDRVIRTNLDFADPQVRVTEVSAHTATIEWETLQPEPSLVEYGTSDDLELAKHDNTVTTTHRVQLTGLTPKTRYTFSVTSPLPVYPGESLRLRRSFVTGSDAAETCFVTLPMAVLLYRKTTYYDMYPVDGYPLMISPRALSDDDIETVKKEIDQLRLFYWRLTRMKLNFACDVYVVEKPLGLKDIADDPDSSYWLGPNERVCSDLEALLGARGKTVTDYAGVLALYPWRTLYGGDADVFATYHGATFGLPSPWHNGRYPETSYTAIPIFEKPESYIRRIDDVMIHETHHQINNYLLSSVCGGHPSADHSGRVQGKFGSTYSFVAYILRMEPEDRWLEIKHGAMTFAADADGDQFPDRDGRVPLDEARAGSSTEKRDTDKDGLSDRDEFCFGVRASSDPLCPDTDEDGLLDGEDPYPLNKFSRQVRKRTPIIDGYIAEGEWDLCTTLPFALGAGEGHVYLNWDDGCLYVAVSRPKSATQRLDINFDLQNNGWCHGRDNLWIYDWGRESQHFVVEGVGEGFGWPRHVPNDSLLVEFANSEHADTVHMEASIARNPEYGLTLTPGDRFGFQIRLSWDESGSIFGLFEPVFAECELCDER